MCWRECTERQPKEPLRSGREGCPRSRGTLAALGSAPGSLRACRKADCSGHPSAGPEGIEFLRDGGTYVEMGQFTDAGSIETSWHRICTKDINILGSWAFTANDLPKGVDLLWQSRDKYPFYEMQTLFEFSEDGITKAIDEAMKMRTVKSTISPPKAAGIPS